LADLHFDTLTVHAGEPEARPRPTVSPIYTASSYVYDTTDELDAAFEGAGPFYRRNGNPTTDAFAAACAVLEGAEGAVAFASGMAALHGALLAAGVKSGDTIVAARDLYGITARLLRQFFTDAGVMTIFTDLTDTQAAAEAITRHRPRAVICESLSNPLLRIADIEALAQMAHEAEAALLVDNTFASPALLQPHTLGADLVVHSATKYLGGHGDALGGVVTANSPYLPAVRAANIVVGAVLAPFEAALLLRGVRTLALRMERHSANAAAIAAWLSEQPEIARVHYPGLPWHPQHALAVKLFEGRGFGGMVSFELSGVGREGSARFIDSLALALPGPTLGDVTTLVMCPAIASHRAFTPEERVDLGIPDSLIRLSVGIENPDDIIADLGQALHHTAEAAHG
jgi:cystathionine gamma-synthase/methionine-gamma-lyase